MKCGSTVPDAFTASGTFLTIDGLSYHAAEAGAAIIAIAIARER